MGRRSGRSRGRNRTHITPDRLTHEVRRELAKAYAGASMADAARAQGGQVMSTADAVQALTGQVFNPDGTMAVRNMPRDPLDNSAFGPLWPLHVQAISPPREDTGQPEPRVWEYPQGFNLPGSGQRLIDWEVLRRAARDVDVMRRCIEIRKEDLAQLVGSWVISEDAIKAAQEADSSKPRDIVEAELRQQFAADIARLTKFWARPWITNGVRLRQWLNAVIEDHIVLDGVAIYPVADQSGKVVAFRLVDAATIKLLINEAGERPQDPYPAFQQVLYGFPRGEYLADVVLGPDGEEIVSNGYTASQLTYWRENVRTYSPYGLSAVEQALLAAALYLKRQGWMHDTYDEAATPDTWLVPQGDKFTATQISPTQRREYERAINDDMAGQSGKRRHIKVSYPGFQPEQMKTEAEQYKPDYDLFLVKMLIGFFGVTPDRFGLSEAKGLGATGQHERDAEVAEDSGVNPDARMLTDLIMELSTNYLDAPPELEFRFAKKKVEDEAAKDAIIDTRLKSGRMTYNEARRAVGDTTYTFPEADMPAFFAATGPLYLEGGAEKQKAMDEAAVELAKNPPPPGGPGGGLGAGGGGPKPKPTAGGPSGRAMSKAAEGERPVRDTAPVEREVLAFRRWSKSAGPTPARPFRFEHAEPADLVAAYPGGLNGQTMAFEGHVWLADGVIEKDWQAWNAANPMHPRGPHGRFVRVGNLIDELRRAGAPLDNLHDSALDDAVRRAQAGRHMRRGESQLADQLERFGLLEELGGNDRGRLSISDAGREYLVRRAPEDYGNGGASTGAPEPDPVPEPPAVDAARARQERVDRARELASMFAEVEEIHGDTKGDAEGARLIAERTGSAAERAPGNADAQAFASVIAGHGEDADAMLASARDWAQRHGMRPVGTVGERVTFDPAQHHAPGHVRSELSGRGRAGIDQVEIVRPGYAWTDPVTGDEVRMDKPRVDLPIEPHQEAPRVDNPTPTAVPEAPSVEDARSQGLADRMRQAEIMYGSDRSKWPPAVQREAARMERKAARAARGGPDRSLVAEAPPVVHPTEAQRVPNGNPGTVDPMNDDQKSHAALEAFGLAESRRLEELARIPGGAPNRKELLAERTALQARRAAALQAVRDLNARHGSPVDRILRDLSDVMDEVEADRTPEARARREQLEDELTELNVRIDVGEGTDSEYNRALGRRETVERLLSEMDQAFEEPKAEAPEAPKPTAGPVAGETMAQTLAQSPSREAAHRVIERLTVPQLRALADEIKAPYSSKDSKAKLRERIVYTAVGSRLDSDAIRGESGPGYVKAGEQAAAARADALAARQQAAGMAAAGVGRKSRAPSKRAQERQAASEAAIEAQLGGGQAQVAGFNDLTSPAPKHPQKQVFDKLLDEGLVKHRQSRQIVEQMEAHGWKLTGQNPAYSTTDWEAPDGRKMAVQFLTGDKPKFYPSGQVGVGSDSYKAALAHVVTPTLEEVGGPNMPSALDRVEPGLYERVRQPGYNDPELRSLEQAMRQLSGYGGTQRRSQPEVSADLRAQAERLRELAAHNEEHQARVIGFGTSANAERQRKHAQQFERIADILDQQAVERATYEAERDRRAALPLDIRPTTRTKR